MAGLNSILEIGRRSLSTSQYGLGVTSHNISNASTPGYSRQRLNVAPSASEKTSYGYLGTGINIQSIQRLRSGYIDQQIYTVNQNMGRAGQRENILRLTESFLQEPSESGLGATMSQFFASFQDLSLHPEESANRNAVVQKASLMVGTFRRITDSIDSLKKDVLKEAESKVDRINALVSSIAGLDQTIMSASASGSSPNDVRDQRDLQVAELSKIADIRVMEGVNGSVNVSIAGNMILSGGNSSSINASMNGAEMELHLSGIPQKLNVTGGELGALMTLQNSTLNSYVAKLDEAASAIITNVNAIHQTGYGIGTPPPTGLDFFTGTDARSIGVNSVISGNINNVATSGDGSPGDNSIALQIANIQNAQILNGNTVSIGQFYNGFVSSLGTDIQSAATENSSTMLVMEQLTTQQNSVAGVSIDEEMTNLIKYQHGFDAAARVINTVNDMFKTIINM
ncbi:MAG: flagellar hook-associated protein FlgK [Bacteroidetes bacterium]|nr:flagellar hook-associated protein FlgK [Bacteroidota bacterium]